MRKYPLWVYVLAGIIVLAAGNYFMWLLGDSAKLRATELASAGFIVGMLAMYIAVRVYAWQKPAIAETESAAGEAAGELRLVDEAE